MVGGTAAALQGTATLTPVPPSLITSAGTLVPRSLSHGGDAPAAAAPSAHQPAGDVHNSAEGARTSSDRGAAAKKGREWRHFAAGGCGGMMGALITCPLEVVKTHLQSKNVARRSISDVVMQISRSSGVLGFWRGIGPMLAGVMPARAVNFWTYNAVKGHLLSSGHAEGPLVHMTGNYRHTQAMYCQPTAISCSTNIVTSMH